MKEHTTADREIISRNILLNLKSNSRNTNWLVNPFRQVHLKSTEHMADVIQPKCQIRALRPISKCIKRNICEIFTNI